MTLTSFVVYLAVCYACGVLGKNRKLGFWGYFVGSLVLTPFIGFLLLLASDERPAANEEPRCRHCGH